MESEEISKIQIKKPKSDDRQYRFLKLPNDLVCCLISDQDCDIAAASMNISVGSLQDPF